MSILKEILSVKCENWDDEVLKWRNWILTKIFSATVILILTILMSITKDIWSMKWGNWDSEVLKRRNRILTKNDFSNYNLNPGYTDECTQGHREYEVRKLR